MYRFRREQEISLESTGGRSPRWRPRARPQTASGVLRIFFFYFVKHFKLRSSSIASADFGEFSFYLHFKKWLRASRVWFCKFFRGRRPNRWARRHLHHRAVPTGLQVPSERLRSRCARQNLETQTEKNTSPHLEARKSVWKKIKKFLFEWRCCFVTFWLQPGVLGMAPRNSLSRDAQGLRVNNNIPRRATKRASVGKLPPRSNLRSNKCCCLLVRMYLFATKKQQKADLTSEVVQRKAMVKKFVSARLICFDLSLFYFFVATKYFSLSNYPRSLINIKLNYWTYNY